MEFGSSQDWILEHPIPFVGAGLSRELPVVCVSCMARGTEVPRLVGLPRAGVPGGRCGAELCGHSSAPLDRRAFSAPLAPRVVNLHRSLGSRIRVPTASPGAPCRCAWEALAEEPPSPAPPVPRACLAPLLPALVCGCVRTRARLCHPFAKGESGIPESLVTTCRCSTSCIIRTDNPCLEISWKLEK